MYHIPKSSEELYAKLQASLEDPEQPQRFDIYDAFNTPESRPQSHPTQQYTNARSQWHSVSDRAAAVNQCNPLRNQNDHHDATSLSSAHWLESDHHNRPDSERFCKAASWNWPQISFSEKPNSFLPTTDAASWRQTSPRSPSIEEPFMPFWYRTPEGVSHRASIDAGLHACQSPEDSPQRFNRPGSFSSQFQSPISAPNFPTPRGNDNSVHIQTSYFADSRQPTTSSPSKSLSLRRTWTTEEDEMLLQAVKVTKESFGDPIPWTKVSTMIPDRSSSMCSKRYRVLMALTTDDQMRPIYTKGPWDAQEDENLLELLAEYESSDNHSPGVIPWSKIGSMLDKPRTGLQACARYTEALDPNVTRGRWSREEDRILVESYIQVGPRWSIICERIPGRTQRQCASRWNILEKRQSS